MTDIVLAFIARQPERLTADVNSMRDDMRLTATLIRQDGTLTALHRSTQIARIRKLEEAP
jgi:hypothetical protein